MAEHKDIQSIFSRFAGREVPLKTFKVPDPAAPYGYPLQHVVRTELADPNDATVSEMKQTAEKNGLSLRLSWPGFKVYGDRPDPDRVTASIEQNESGVWRVNNFRLG